MVVTSNENVFDGRLNKSNCVKALALPSGDGDCENEIHGIFFFITLSKFFRHRSQQVPSYISLNVLELKHLIDWPYFPYCCYK